MAALASKRKRENSDMPNPRAAPGMAGSEFDQHYLNTAGDAMDTTDASMDFAAALAQHNLGVGPEHQHEQAHMSAEGHPHDNAVPSASDTAAAAMAQYHTMTVPQSTEQAFMSHAPIPDNNNERPQTASVDQGDPSPDHRHSSFGGFDISNLKDAPQPSNGEGSPPAANTQGQNSQKFQVGTDEWHKLRRDNHKEVERRRRETINEGINELAKIVPGCEKNKGSILARAVQFITQLKENESQNIEKWTLEKLLTEQAIQELSSSCDKLKAECQRAWNECEQWKTAATKAGATIEHDEKAADQVDSEEA